MNKQKENFREAVLYALQHQNEFVEITQTGKTNPYYLGFGNPESDIIIYGQEKAIPANEIEQIWLESNQNPNQWEKYLKGEITERHQKLYSNLEKDFRNPLQPYRNYPDGGTWKNYQTIASNIYADLQRDNNEATFLEKSFISEINHIVAKNQRGNQRDEIREIFLKQDFFKNFPVTILAIGSYLKSDAIKDWFEVDFSQDLSQPYRKLLVYRSRDCKRLVLQTRQMSRLMMNIEQRTAYFNLITKLTQEHLKIKTI